MSRKKYSRRLVLRAMGYQLILPLFANYVPISALAQSGGRNKFVGVFFPNGIDTPDADLNGAWDWNDPDSILYSLRQGANKVNQHCMMIRNLHNQGSQRDPHWQNCAGYLSSNLINLDVNNVYCGKTIDQEIADKQIASGITTPFRSLEIGGPYFHTHELPDHPNYSHIYMNRISWRTANQPITPISDPYELFERLFVTGGSPSGELQYRLARKQSILDNMVSDITSVKNKTNGEGRQMIDRYLTGVREIEQSLEPPSCTAPSRPTANYDDRNVNYVDRYQQFNKMVAVAMGCGLTNVATMMLAPAVSGRINYSGDIGPGKSHHNVAHHGGVPSERARLTEINKMQVGLLKHLINQMKGQGVFDESLVLYGTDMSNGNVHATKNLPTLLCGGGSDFRFGQEVTLTSQQVPFAGLLLSVLKEYGINKSAQGQGSLRATGDINNLIKT